MNKFLALFLVSLTAFALGCSSESTVSNGENGSGSEDRIVNDGNTSSSAEEASKAFMDTLIADGYDAALMYVHPDYRSGTDLETSWNNPSFEITGYEDMEFSENPDGYVVVSFTSKGKWAGSDYEGTSGLVAAEMDGVWWIVPSSYQWQ